MVERLREGIGRRGRIGIRSGGWLECGYSAERNEGVLHMGNDHEGRWEVEPVACALDLKPQDRHSSSTPRP